MLSLKYSFPLLLVVFQSTYPASGSTDCNLPTCPATRPNFVFILTDDQDLHLNSIDYQPSVQKHFRDEGLTFEQHHATIAICCPSRVSLLTGKAAHNTNVTDVKTPYGGYPKFISQGWNEKWLPLWLQNEGYQNYYVGKLMNAHNTTNYNSPYPSGFNGTEFLLDPYTYSYLNATMQRNQDAPRNYKGNYSTDLVAEKALGFLDDAAANPDEPFFLGIAPIGPHSDSENLNAGNGFLPPVSAERHAHMFLNVTVPRTLSFNPSVASGASYMLDLPVQNATNLEYNDEWYRLRLRALQAVDDLVDTVVRRLDDLDLLDNTYLFYTSDNGFHIGQHRLQPGKTCPIEEDTGVPMFLRGPGVPNNQSVAVPTTHTDIIPTIFELAGINLHDDFDGTPMPTTDLAIANSTGRPEHVNIEFWGTAGGEGKYGYASPNNTYKVARVVSADYSLFYTVWCTNEHELYDMRADPGQLNNLYASPNQTLLERTVEQVAARLDALVLVLKTCEGGVCIKPWQELHPAGDVVNLKQALGLKYDEFYLQEQNKVAFQACELGYLIESEQPVNWYTFDV